MRPEPTAPDWLDNLELSHDRLLMLFQVDPGNLDEPPKLLLEEFDSTRDLDNLEPGGAVWLYPEDLFESHRVAAAVAGELPALQGVRCEEVPRSLLG